ncbi:MAG: type II toxin-antitoxin system RelE/ParE family toxin [Sphingomonas sp.]
MTAHPFAFRPGRIAGTREAVVHPNYIVIYRASAEIVEIVNVVHARQRYP